MDKLIELLNEYDNIEKYGIKRKIGTDPIGIYGYLNGYGLGFTSKARIISKDYGFIKRLVDNDKIDKEKFEDEFFACGCCGYKSLSTRETCNACGDEVLNIYDALLMRLSIQDEPIEFLISILK